MGNPKQKWTPEEEEALKAGVAKHGTGKWKDIQRDPEFNRFLSTRSNIDLKDKWRNMSVASGQGPRDKSRQPKAKANPDAPSTQLPTVQTSTATPAAARVAASTPNADDSSKGGLSDAKSAAMYNAMIFEVLSTSKDQNGLDTSSIASYIEQRHEVPQNFRRLLSSRLRRLVAQDKLEKVHNCFKRKSDTSTPTGTKTPAVKQEDNQIGKLQNASYVKVSDPIEEAAVAAAYKIAEAENKSFVAAEAIKEVERISKMAEETESMLLLAKEIFEKCSKGEMLC